MDTYPPTRQRPALLSLAEALGSRENALRRDACGDWRISGRYGWIYAVPEGFQITFRGANEGAEPASSQGWTYAKRALAFCRVLQDCDTEGSLILNRLPTNPEAEILRDKLRIAKKREISQAELARLRRMGFRHADDGSNPTAAKDD